MKNLLLLCGIAGCLQALAVSPSDSTVKQTPTFPTAPPDKPDLRYNISTDGSRYIRLTMLNQVWVRWNENNAGSTVNANSPEASTFDISLRRTRFQLIGQITPKVLFYAQFGANNFSYESFRKFNFFIHDALCEYAFLPQFQLGFGLNGWTGPARFSSPGVAGFLGIDAPLFEQGTNDINDQFLRKLGIYAKGKIGKLDYRVAVGKPFIVQTSAATVGTANTGAFLAVPSLSSVPENVATFSTKAPELQYQGYFMYQLLDQEAQQVSYTQGTYLGKKEIFNIGAGFVFQNNAMWYYKNIATKDTGYAPLRFLAIDVYYDRPLNKEKGTALSIYASFMNNSYGPNYVMNRGINNPTDGKTVGVSTNPTLANQTNISGGGNTYALAGTGNTLYAQAGYVFKNNLLGEWGTLLPYVDIQASKFDYYRDWMVVYDLGINWLLKGHQSKFTLNYQNRPVFGTNAAAERVVNDRKSTITLQYQVFF